MLDEAEARCGDADELRAARKGLEARVREHAPKDDTRVSTAAQAAHGGRHVGPTSVDRKASWSDRALPRRQKSVSVWTPSSPIRHALAPGDPVRVVAGDLRGATGTLLEVADDGSWWVAFETRRGAAPRTILLADCDVQHVQEPRRAGPKAFAPVDPGAKRAAARRATERRTSSASRTSTLALTQDQHRELIRRRFAVIRRGVAADAASIALERIDGRMARGRWSGRGRYERPTLRRRPSSRHGFRVRDIPCDTAELLIVGLLSATRPDLQFSITPDGHAFTGRRRGYHEEDARIYVSGLSPAIDAAAEAVLDATDGAGGRIYVHSRTRIVEGAADRRVVARLV